ncbi:FlhC family transcriptional regulator [Cupriavidus pauculus]|uniref:FlhC family transcriptional regulator n=1 Tax=Cupriavidus pauculus TaxID=82633 RepID=UPI001EE19818|nr:FlhC family transcriptional regulator [Cupriavidus pauculus]GJG97745.1 hypothetical protein CBA19C6_24670 [Cupriavidus pauculus]
MHLDPSTVEVEKLILDSYRRDRIRTANYYFTDYLAEAVSAYPILESILRVSREDIAALRSSQDAHRDLMGTPFSVVTPVLTEVADWQCLISGGPPTRTVENLRAQIPTWPESDALRLLYNNRDFSLLVMELLHRSAVAAPLLGISLDLAKYLRSLSPHAFDLAIQMAGFPAFRWRLQSKKFWIDLRSRHLSRECLGHHILESTPLRAHQLRSTPRRWAIQVDPAMKPVYCDLMVRQRFRASVVADVLGFPIEQVRKRHRLIHRRPSVSGQLPQSKAWYFETASHRLQATMVTTLHRAARADGYNPVEALIAAYDLFRRFFGEESRVTPERSIHAAQLSESGAHLRLAPCKMCETPYLVANSPDKIGMPTGFQCPGCFGKFHVRRRTAPGPLKTYSVNLRYFIDP